LKNQGEILHQIRELNTKVGRVEYQLRDLEEKLVKNFDNTNEKTFHEVIFLSLNFIFFNIIIINNLILI